VVTDEVMKKYDNKNLAVHVVWTPVLGPDNREEALEARKYISDPRVKHYWDGTQSLGLAYGKAVKLPSGRELAWDIYFAYQAGKEWGDDLPEPDDWYHRLGKDDKHLGDGSGLSAAVKKLLSSAESAAKHSVTPDAAKDRHVVTIKVGGMKKSHSGAT
jgi:hypothetical protein